MLKKLYITLLAAAIFCCAQTARADTQFPNGTYIFDFHNFNCTEVNLFQPTAVTDNVSFDSSHPLNAGTVNDPRTHYYRSDGASYIQYLVLRFNRVGDIAYTNASENDQFIQVMINSTWTPSGSWTKFGTHTLSPVTGTTDTYLCVVGSDGTFSWSTDASLLPSTIPRVYFSAGDHGSVGTHTAGGNNISTGAAVEEGTAVNLVATPETGYAFFGWRDANGSIVSTAANYVFSMPSTNVSLTAVFYTESTDPVIEDCDGCFLIRE